jgi:hypothetical protein
VILNVCALEDRSVPAAFIVNTDRDTNDANPGDGLALDANNKTSLRAGVQEANALCANNPFNCFHMVTFTEAMTVVLQSSMDPFVADITVNQARPIGIFDPPLAPIEIKGAGGFPLFKIEDGSLSAFGGPFQISGGSDAMGHGGAFRVEGILNLYDCAIFNNSARLGGAISVASTGVLFADACQIHSNYAALGGGGVESYGSLSINHGSEVYDNHALDGSGGGIFVGAGPAYVGGNSEIYANTAKNNGGGVYNMGFFEMSGGKMFLNEAIGTSVEGQYFDGKGGGLYNRKLGETGGSVILSGVLIERNTARNKGGAMYLAANSTTNIENCTVRQNVGVQGANGIAFEPGAAFAITGNIDEDQWPVEV